MENYLKNYNRVDSNDPGVEATADFSREAQRLRYQASQTKDPKKQTQLLREAAKYDEYISELQPNISARERQNIDRQREAKLSANRNKSGMSDYASTKEQFNPRNDPDVWAQNLVTSDKLDGGKVKPISENFVWTPRNEKIEGLNRDLDIQDGKRRFGATPTAAINALHESNKGKNYSVGQTQPYYSTPESAKRAAPYANNVSYVGGKNPKYDKLDAVGQVLQPGDTMGYVPKAEKVADATKENYLNSPSVQKILQRTRESNAAREAANSPADMAAYKSRMFDNYAKMQARDGKPESAKMWSGWAKEQEAKARQLGYKGDIAKATVKDPAAKPNPPTATAGAPKPATSTTAAKPPASTASTPKPASPIPAAKPKPAPSSVPKPAQPTSKPTAPVSAATYRANQQEAERNAIGFRPQEIKQTDIDAAKKRSESYKRDAEIYNKHAQDYERQGNKTEAERMKAMAARSEKGAQVAARNAADLEKSKSTRDAEISSWDEKKKKYDSASASEKKAMADIPKLSEPVKKTIIKFDDPTQEILNNATPSLDNSSAYNTSGSGGGSGVAGFFTRDGKVIPITA